MTGQAPAHQHVGPPAVVLKKSTSRVAVSAWTSSAFAAYCLVAVGPRKSIRERGKRPKSLVFLLPREEDHLRTRNQDRRQRTSSPTSTLDLEEIPESWAASSLTKKAAAAAPRLLNTSDSANVRGTDQALRLFGNFLPLVWTHVIYIDVLLKLKLTLIMIWFIYPSELP